MSFQGSQVPGDFVPISTNSLIHCQMCYTAMACIVQTCKMFIMVLSFHHVHLFRSLRYRTTASIVWSYKWTLLPVTEVSEAEGLLFVSVSINFLSPLI